jgi:hypothetical protein
VMSVPAAVGSRNQEVDLSGLAPGSYAINCTSPDGAGGSARFVKR